MNLVSRLRTVEALERVWNAFPFSKVLEWTQAGLYPTLEEEFARLEAPISDGLDDR